MTSMTIKEASDLCVDLAYNINTLSQDAAETKLDELLNRFPEFLQLFGYNSAEKLELYAEWIQKEARELS